MRNILWLLILVIFLGSCVTPKRCANKFPPITTIEEVIVVKDSIIYVQLPPDTVNITDTIQVIDGISNLPPKRLDTKFCYSIAEVRDNVLYFNLYQKSDSVTTVIKYYETIKTVTVDRPLEIIVPKELTWWQNLYLTTGKIGMFLVIAVVGLYLVRFFIKSKFKFI